MKTVPSLVLRTRAVNIQQIDLPPIRGEEFLQLRAFHLLAISESILPIQISHQSPRQSKSLP